MTTEAEKSLYERIGGYDAIAAATDDLLQRLTSHPPTLASTGAGIALTP